MLDPEYVERVEREMAENGGRLPPDDHKEIWRLLRFFSRSNDQAELALRLVTDAPCTEAMLLAEEVAAIRHPKLGRQEAIECELHRLAFGEELE